MLSRLISLFRRRRIPEFVLPEEGDLLRTPSGLGVHVLERGTGEKPAANDTVTVRYAGWLIEGKLFDASYPGTATFPLNRVVRGWTEGLQHVAAGGSVILVIPPELAYGSRGAPPRIGPGATLVFRVELVSIDG